MCEGISQASILLLGCEGRFAVDVVALACWSVRGGLGGLGESIFKGAVVRNDGRSVE